VTRPEITISSARALVEAAGRNTSAALTVEVGAAHRREA
jgi:hypothetical protein